MQIKYKISILVVTVTALVFSHLYTYYLASEKENFKNFLSDMSYSYILLGAIEDNKTVIVKSLLVNNIERVFIETENIDIDLFKPICEYINKKNNLMLKMYAKNIGEGSSALRERVSRGKKKIEKLCLGM